MNPDLEMALRLLMAAALGGIIGFQREKSGKPAGLRTHILICLGATIFTLVSVYAFAENADPSRIAAGVVSGIGFIGAGAIILRSEENLVTGLTTAATIWLVAGIGVAIGAGLYIAAVVTTIIAMGILFLPHFK